MPETDLSAASLHPVYVDAAEAARLLDVPRQQVYRLLDSGQLEGCRRGSRRLVLLASLQAYTYRLSA